MTVGEFERVARAVHDELASATRGERFARVSEELRAKVVVTARRGRREGRTWRVVARALGVERKKLQRWCAEERATAKWVPVEIVEAPAAVAQSRLAVVLPNGVRLEGVSVGDAPALLRALL